MYSPAHILPFAAERFGDKTALVSGDSRLTYRQLDQMSNSVAHGLVDLGVGPGQTVSLHSQNRWEYIVAYHGVLKVGAVVNPINVMLTGDELAYVLEDCSATVAFVDGTEAQRVCELAGVLPHLKDVIGFGAPAGTIPFDSLLDGRTDPTPAIAPGPTEPSTIGYTSGTTGHPKGAVQSHQAVLLNCALTATMHQRHPNDTVVSALPLPHVYGNVVANSTFLAGGTVVLMQRFDTAEALKLIETHRATMFEGVPAMYAMMLADPALAGADLRSLTRCTVGGQTLPVATLTKWQSVSGAPLIELWGMTEIAGIGLTHALHAPPKPGSVGVSLPGIEIRVVSLTDGATLMRPGEAGELMVRGPIVMLGYHNNAAATTEAIDPDGWLHTGDIATIDATGHVQVVDRLKDIIITGGYNIYPAEIERVLAEHPDVALVAVGPIPDPVKGEIACAYIVRAPGCTPSEEAILVHARAHLAAYKRPRLIRFVDSLPTTSSGKVMRRKLRESSEQGVGADVR